MFVGIAMYFVWPVVQNGIYALGGLVTGTGYFGTLIFGIVKRALIPFGLHHVFYLPFWQTAVGGTMEVGGKLIQGGQNIFFAQLADSANITHFSADATRYFSGEFIFMIFGLPGAALAMYHTAYPAQKKMAAGLLLTASLCSVLTGVTEPLEFAFMFLAPGLFLLHAILMGISMYICAALPFRIGFNFSAGLMDYFMCLNAPMTQNPGLLLPVGLLFGLLYYIVFRFCILHFHLKTPGREASEKENEKK